MKKINGPFWIVFPFALIFLKHILPALPALTAGSFLKFCGIAILIGLAICFVYVTFIRPFTKDK